MIYLEKLNTMSTIASRAPLSILLFIGILSVFYAEVNSGSYPLWFSNPWGLLIVFWLYFAHLLFYVNIALRTKRVSLTQLYLLGCLVGLYEGPITKVLWHGYPGQTASTFFLGFEVFEFMMLVFFWHPIFSFLLPIVFFELLSLKYFQDNQMSSWLQNTIFFSKPRLAKFLLLAIAFIGATFLSVNGHFNLPIILFSGIINVGLLTLLRWHNTKTHKLKGIQSLYLSNKWFGIVIIYLILLYTLTFIFLAPEYIPQTITLVLTGLIYIFIFIIFLLSPVNKKFEHYSISPLDYNKLIQYSWILWLVFLVMFTFIAGTISVELILLYLFLLVFGTILFITRILKILYIQIRHSNIDVN